MSLIILLLSPPASALEGDVRIFVPESLTDVSSARNPVVGGMRGESYVSTTFRKIALVGKVEKAGPIEVEVINNNRLPVKPVFHEGYFHAEIVLSLGSNLIEIRWRKKGEAVWNSKVSSIFRSSKLEGEISSNYPPYVFHLPKNEEECQACHKMRLTQAEIDTGLEKSCMVCHQALTENLFVHGPVSVGICTVCHDRQSEPNKYVVGELDVVLCYDCHTDRESVDKGKRLMHGPVGAGLCTICHDPHSSPYEFQLVKDRNEICLLCHQDDADRWMGQLSLHPPFRDGNCAGCHDPHSSDYDYNLKANRQDICALCHELPIPGHLHEAGSRPLFKLPEDFPLAEDGRTMCLTCHDPHGAKGESLTRRAGCDGCHPK